MNTALSRQLDHILLSAHVQPAVSIILPFDPKMVAKKEITERIQRAVAKVESSLADCSDQPFARLVSRKLKHIVGALNFSSFRKALAIYVSPVFEKVLYLDIEVDEKVMVEDSFEIRDLVYAKKEERRFLLLVLGERQHTVWLFNGIDFQIIQSTSFSGYADGNRNAGLSLLQLLASYPFPVMVTGADERINHFKLFAGKQKNIVAFLPTNTRPDTPEQIAAVTAPVRSNWRNLHDQSLLNRIGMAADKGKLSMGIDACQEKAGGHAKNLLVVEKNFMAPSVYSDDQPDQDRYDHFSCIKDPVDDLMERVLSAGGDVEFVCDGMLAEYGHIVLIDQTARS